MGHFATCLSAEVGGRYLHEPVGESWPDHSQNPSMAYPGFMAVSGSVLSL
jgi:hypothetical protein